MRSLGIDPSASATGMALLKSMPDGPPFAEWHHTITAKPAKGMERARIIVLDVMTTIHSVEPDVIVVEGYSLNMKNASSVIPLVELGGLLRFMLMIDGLSWLAPRATELKKFVTGSGASNKSSVMMHVLKRWGFEAPNDNVADAFGLAAMGLAHANRLPGATLEMRKIAGSLPLLTS